MKIYTEVLCCNCGYSKFQSIDIDRELFKCTKCNEVQKLHKSYMKKISL